MQQVASTRSLYGVDSPLGLSLVQDVSFCPGTAREESWRLPTQLCQLLAKIDHMHPGLLSAESAAAAITCKHQARAGSVYADPVLLAFCIYPCIMQWATVLSRVNLPVSKAGQAACS